MKKIFFLVLILLPLMFMAKAPKPAEEALRIKLSKNQYWWGEAYDLKSKVKKPQERQALKEKALADLVNRIRVHVFSEILHSEGEADGQLSSQSEINVRLSSAQYLSNVHYLEYREKKRYYVLAYLSRQDYQNIQREQIQCVQSFMQTAQKHELEGNLSYIRDYLSAYLLAQNLGQNLEFEGKELGSYIKNKIQSLMQSLPLSAKIGKADTMGNYPITIQSSNANLAGAIIYDLPELGFSGLKMIEGQTKLFYEGNPSKKELELQLNLRPDMSSFMDDDLLAEAAKSLRMNQSRRLVLDFSEHVNVDFEYDCDGLACSFYPQIEGLSIARMYWDFGDGSSSDTKELQVNHFYRRGGIFQVSLKINDDIEVVKYVKVEGTGLSELKPSTPNLPSELVPVVQSSEEWADFETNFAEKLSGYRNVQELIGFLDEHKKMGYLVWGYLKMDEDTRDSWLVLLEPQSGEVLEILKPEGGVHVAYSDKHNVPSLSEEFKGKLAIYVILIGD